WSPGFSRRDFARRSAINLVAPALIALAALYDYLCPSGQVLMETLLRFELIRDDHDCSFRETSTQQGRQERLSGSTDAGTGQQATLLHARNHQVGSGSLQCLREQIACREEFRLTRQAPLKSQRESCGSNPDKSVQKHLVIYQVGACVCHCYETRADSNPPHR